MSFYSSPSFDFIDVIYWYGSYLYGTVTPGFQIDPEYVYHFQFEYSNTPTNQTEYDSWVTWQDPNPQPTWTELNTTAYNAYCAWLLSFPVPEADINTIIASLAPVAMSGSYASLTSKPTIPDAQVQSDWNASSGLGVILNKPTIPVASKAYEGTTLRANAFPIIKSATVASGVATFYLTSDGTSTGTALFSNGIIADSIQLLVNDATASYQMSYALTNSNKTLTVTANKLSTANILTGVLGQVAANGAVVKLTVYGY